MTNYVVDDIRERIDLRYLVEESLGRPTHQGQGAWNFKCPFHQEHKGASLAVWKGHWKCYGACKTGGSVFDWVMKLHQCDFKEALSILTNGAVNTNTRYERPAPTRTATYPPTYEWQDIAQRVIQQAQKTLWSPAGAKPLQWLRGRGLGERIIREAQLGYLPGKWDEWHAFGKFEQNGDQVKFSLPSGVVIPWIAGDQVWAVKVRLAGGDMKYKQAAGGKIAGGLYWADKVQANKPILFTEGEFDCLVADQEMNAYGYPVHPVTCGSSSGSLDERWYPLVWSSRRQLVAYDNDEAGEKGATDLMDRLGVAARRVQLVGYKDINEAYLAGADLWKVIKEGLK